jgi:hypothetical protein
MRRSVSVAGVLVAGIAIALVWRSALDVRARKSALISAVASDDAAVRSEAWNVIPAESDLDFRRRIELAFRNASADARSDAAHAFLERAWQPTDQVAAVALAIAAATQNDPEPTLSWFTEAWRKHPAALSNWSPALFAVMQQDQRDADPSTDHALDRILAADQTPWLEAIERWRAAQADELPQSAIESIDLALGMRGRSPASIESETTAMQMILAGKHDREDASDRSPTWFLAAQSSESAASTMKRRAANGEEDARIAIALQDHTRTTQINARVLANSGLDLDRRIIAASRLIKLKPPDDATLLNLLAAGPANADGTVHGLALIAQHGLSETARRRLINRWWSLEDPSRRRAATMIATLDALDAVDADTDSDGETLAVIQRLATIDEPDADVRRTARLALRALGHWPLEDVTAAAYASRTCRLSDGRFDPDAVLLGLLAGDPAAARQLTSQPDLPNEAASETDRQRWASEIAWRVAIARALRPRWFEVTGEPIPGDVATLRRWIDLLEACRRTDPAFAGESRSGEDGST